jgi:hypothetical protein
MRNRCVIQNLKKSKTVKFDTRNLKEFCNIFKVELELYNIRNQYVVQKKVAVVVAKIN